MISIKKTILTIGLALTLSACDFSSESYKEAHKYLTPLENSMLETYYENNTNSDYDKALSHLIYKRSTTPYLNTMPFCDILDVLDVQKNDGVFEKNNDSLSVMWISSKGQSLTESCSKKNEKLAIHTVEMPPSIEKENISEYAKVETVVKEEEKISKYNNASKLLTLNEKILFNNYFEDHSANGYDDIFDLLTAQRIKSPYNEDIPFCDVIETLTLIEIPSRSSVKNGFSVIKQWESVNKTSLALACALLNQNKSIASISTNNQKQPTSSIAIESHALSSESVFELSELTKTCFSAKIKLNVLMTGKRLFSVDDMQTIENIKLDCAYAALTNELNTQ
jgi:hypothetical protein